MTIYIEQLIFYKQGQFLNHFPLPKLTTTSMLLARLYGNTYSLYTNCLHFFSQIPFSPCRQQAYLYSLLSASVQERL